MMDVRPQWKDSCGDSEPCPGLVLWVLFPCRWQRGAWGAALAVGKDCPCISSSAPHNGVGGLSTPWEARFRNQRIILRCIPVYTPVACDVKECHRWVTYPRVSLVLAALNINVKRWLGCRYKLVCIGMCILGWSSSSAFCSFSIMRAGVVSGKQRQQCQLSDYVSMHTSDASHLLVLALTVLNLRRGRERVALTAFLK